MKPNEWLIIENATDLKDNKVAESIFSIGNGSFGQRANFEETFTGATLQGNYVAGVYYPDKTRVGWWKNGYPEYFAKVLNSVNWIGLRIFIDQIEIDLNHAQIISFQRILNMQEGLLSRKVELRLVNGNELLIETERFCSIHNHSLAALNYKVKAINFSAPIALYSYLDFDVRNEDANYDEKFWLPVQSNFYDQDLILISKTKKTAFEVAAALFNETSANLKLSGQNNKEQYIEQVFEGQLNKGETAQITKYVSIRSTLQNSPEALAQETLAQLQLAKIEGFEALKMQQKTAWLQKWNECDITITGDVAAQQGIRFNIFQLYQTYTGKDERLNIGPKGFTGEKYGGSTYWDTEAYCLPFYLSTASQKVARQLLIYRYKHLGKAIENAKKLGFSGGAALYPMVTMNGEECHNEWEITFEEIHRNGTMAYAIFNYVKYTGDVPYLADYGFEVLVAIARFWAQRVHWSSQKMKFVMHGVTGPNEFENNVNNNWYTNYIATWCLRYTIEVIQTLTDKFPGKLKILKTKVNFSATELDKWKEIIAQMYYPVHPDNERIFLQQDGFLDKELIPTSDLDPKQRPIVEHWSWDRILRSVYIKQGDVLQGMYFFEHEFDKETVAANFNFYEPFTVHESSLSPCIHSVIAAYIGNSEKAYKFYLRTARLDLDNINNDTKDGCHITSMAGSWLSVVQGFAGMRVQNNSISFKPFIPKQWNSYSFKIIYRLVQLKITVSKSEVKIENLSSVDLPKILVYEKEYFLKSKDTINIALIN